MTAVELAPHSVGTLVTCVTPPPLQLPLRRDCRHHLFEILTAAEPVDYAACGYIQSARCLVCGYDTPRIDGDFFHHKADGMDLAACLGGIYEHIEWLELARDKLLAYFGDTEAAERVPMLRNFD